MVTKRTFFLSLILLLLLPYGRAMAVSVEFDKALDGEIREYGVFDGKNGIIYASVERFEDSDALFVAQCEDGILSCKLFDDTDGIQCTDILSIPTGGDNAYTVSLAKEDGMSYIRLDTTINQNTVTEMFSVQNDAFTRIQKDINMPYTPVMSYINGAVSTAHTSQELYNFLNSLKENRIKLYSLNDDINVTDDTLFQNIKLLITACADITRFDIRAYDYDELMKYILNTNENFRVLTSLSPSGRLSGNVGLVNSDYIDYILINYFRITPEHPPVNSLVSRGFCFDNGYYYYKKMFNGYFSTEISGISHIYNAGGGVYFVIFKDIYRRANDIIPEYSYAVIQTNQNNCSLLRIGMGDIPPSQNEILSYASPGVTPAPAPNDSSPYLRVGAAMIMAGILALFCILIALKRRIG